MNKKIVMLVVAAAVLTLVHMAEAQKPTKVRRVGFLSATGAGQGAFQEVFRQGLRELGYVEGHNIVIEYRSAESRTRLAELATELVGWKAEVIVVAGGAQSGHMMWMQVGPGPDKLVSTKIELPRNWDKLLKQAEEDLGPIPNT